MKSRQKKFPTNGYKEGAMDTLIGFLIGTFIGASLGGVPDGTGNSKPG